MTPRDLLHQGFMILYLRDAVCGIEYGQFLFWEYIRAVQFWDLFGRRLAVGGHGGVLVIDTLLIAIWDLCKDDLDGMWPSGSRLDLALVWYRKQNWISFAHLGF